jgi:hypothetical protein
MLRQHIMIMYAIFFMFLGISLLIIFVMVPMLETQSNLGGGFQNQFVFTNPCASQAALVFPCAPYTGVAATMGLSPESIGSYYVSLFFFSLIIQGLFVGLITGQLGENSVTAGIKHSLIMVFVTVAIFLFFSKMGLLPA